MFRTTLRRGAEIFAFGLLFRWRHVIAWGWVAMDADLFRVDILNTIGASMMLMAVVCWAAKLPRAYPLASRLQCLRVRLLLFLC